ncbi:g2386 [Coccomyxa viridis]|uniref:G2386 protein n=1 Tax=Coccomyxa viridis TaxID=1274662 RepID=A0ABP1FP86_9CHLO
MPTPGSTEGLALSERSLTSGCGINTKSLDCANDRADPSTSKAGGDYKQRARHDYYDKYWVKLIELHHIDNTRRNMYKELQRDYERKLSWARSLGIDPLSEGFDLTTPAPPELSSWLYLFNAYLQLEETHAETSEWLNFPSSRLIDPAPPLKSFREEAREFWDACTLCFTLEPGKPGSRASQHKRF